LLVPEYSQPVPFSDGKHARKRRYSLFVLFLSAILKRLDGVEEERDPAVPIPVPRDREQPLVVDRVISRFACLNLSDVQLSHPHA
jgi:hypothetical protein